MPAAGRPLFQAAVANLNPWSEVKVETQNPDRGPLLIIAGGEDHTVPWAICNGSYRARAPQPGRGHRDRQARGSGHALTIDHGWREVADTALAFVQRFVEP